MDMDRQADEAWILSVQSKLYQWSQANPGDQWRDMWSWLTVSFRQACVTPSESRC
jgi:retron-type reverse transcriptase